MAFLETPRFPSEFLYGSDGGPAYNTTVTIVSSGRESRNQNWLYPLYRYHANLIETPEDLGTLIDFFHVVKGRADGFRVIDRYDFKSGAITSAVAFDDQVLGDGDGTTTAFQLRKGYTQGATTQYRLITKPVSGTVVAGAGAAGSEVEYSSSQFSVDTTTGIVTLSADSQSTVSDAVSAGANTTITTSAAHGLSNGDTVHMSNFNVASDWAALNGLRFAVTVVSGSIFTIVFDSSTFAAYSSDGGQTNTLAQTGEQVVAGFEFDVPVRFDTDQLSTRLIAYQTGEANVPLVEIRL